MEDQPAVDMFDTTSYTTQRMQTLSQLIHELNITCPEDFANYSRQDLDQMAPAWFDVGSLEKKLWNEHRVLLHQPDYSAAELLGLPDHYAMQITAEEERISIVIDGTTYTMPKTSVLTPTQMIAAILGDMNELRTSEVAEKLKVPASTLYDFLKEVL